MCVINSNPNIPSITATPRSDPQTTSRTVLRLQEEGSDEADEGERGEGGQAGGGVVVVAAALRGAAGGGGGRAGLVAGLLLGGGAGLLGGGAGAGGGGGVAVVALVAAVVGAGAGGVGGAVAQGEVVLVAAAEEALAEGLGLLGGAVALVALAGAGDVVVGLVVVGGGDLVRCQLLLVWRAGRALGLRLRGISRRGYLRRRTWPGSSHRWHRTCRGTR